MKKLIALVAGVGLACGTHSMSDEQVGSSTAALTIPGTLAVPADPNTHKPLWDGTIADLYIADAWANCSFLATTDASSGDSTAAGDANDLVSQDSIFLAANPRPPGSHDAYMDYVLGKMTSAQCYQIPDPNPFVNWYQQRQDPNCNVDGAGKSNAVVMTPVAVPSLLDKKTQGVFGADAAADEIIRAPGINACIAQTLRSIMPGAAGPAVLTLSAADQRELLEYTRERAEQAVLGYARLTHLAATPRDPLKPNTYDLQVVQNWFQDPIVINQQSVPNLRVAQIGANLASALQLLTLVSGELLEVYGRSASAHVPRGGNANPTAADEEWGPGSWRQRAYGLLYGGDPLGVRSDPNPPWRHFDQGVQSASVINADIPYVSQDVREPQIEELLRLARQFDALDLRQVTVSQFMSIDNDASANRLYRAVEAGIETADCTVFASNVCSAVTAESLPDPSLGTTSFVLWTKYRISLAHAARLVNVLAQRVGRVTHMGPVNDPTNIVLESAGASDVIGAESIITRSLAPDAGQYYHIDKGAQFLDRISTVRQQGVYNRNGTYDLRESLFAQADSDDQGFKATGLEDRRVFGVVPALVATREELFLARQLYVDLTDVRDGLFSDYASELNLISGAVGDNAFFMETPATSLDGSSPGQPVTIKGPRGVVVYAPSADTSWGTPGSAIVSTQMPLDPAGWTTAAVFLDSTTTTFAGSTQATALNVAVTSNGAGAPSDLASLTRPLKRWVFPNLTPQGRVFAFQNSPASYSYLAGPFSLSARAFMSTGGALNTNAERLIKVQEENPSRAKYDGFGYPILWVPPTDPTLLGSTGGSAVTTYVDDAQRAADSAVAAVTVAFTTLLADEQTALTVQAQSQKSAQVIQAADKALCGDNNPKCNLTLVEVDTLSATNKQHEADLRTTCNTAPDPGQKQLACATQSIFKSYDGKGKLGAEVVNALSTHNVSFDTYTGGKLQEVFINEYYGYTVMQQQLEQVFTAYKVAEGHRDTAQKALALFNQQASDACSPEAMAEAVAKGVGVSTGFASATVSFSLGPLLDQINKCKGLTESAPVENAKAVEAFATSVNDMANEAIRASDAARTLSLSVAVGNETIEGAKLAKEQANMDAVIATMQITNSALYRRYHNYDIWRANALMESARRYAVAARRAIEARFVVDLSELQDNEPFVASPSSWADQIYEYDLSAPAAVGLTASSSVTTAGVYPNAIVDYVGNLQRFVKGYAVRRPTATTQGDSDVISLPGPLGSAQPGSLPNGVIDDSAYKWTYFCPKSASWVTLPDNANLDAICGSDPVPTLAKLQFSLDPWARLDGSIAAAPFTKRFNARWGRAVINLVGTGVLDCSKAPDPLTCYSQAFVPYDLTHTGPGWVTDYDQNWRSLGIPLGQVEGAKALAAEEWLDPLANGWSKPFVTAIARSELAERPFGGAYTVTFHLSPAVNLSHIERVQLLLESAYWVKQQ